MKFVQVNSKRGRLKRTSSRGGVSGHADVPKKTINKFLLIIAIGYLFVDNKILYIKRAG